jgi:hypothetical protein
VLAQAPGPRRDRTIDPRAILRIIVCLDRTGVQWRVQPHNRPAWSHVSYVRTAIASNADAIAS